MPSPPFFSNLTKHTSLEKLLALIVDDTINEEQAWTLFLNWLITQLNEQFTIGRHAQRMLQTQIAVIVVIDANIIATTDKKLTGILPLLNLTEWSQT